MKGNRFHFIFVLILLVSCKENKVLPTPETTDLVINLPADSITFTVIGDFGKAGIPEGEVADLVKSWNPDFIITTGDNNYESGEYSTLVENISAYYGDYIYNFDAPEIYRCNGNAFSDSINRFFPCPGNHDGYSKDDLDPYLNFFTLPGNESYYTFTWGPVTFYSLNTVTGDLNEQKDWLFSTLDTTNSPFNIVYFHHSPYTPGPYDNNTDMQWDYLGHKVDMVMNGHSHLYARIEKKDERGLYYIVNGLGGKSLYDCDMKALSPDLFDVLCFDSTYGAIQVKANDQTLKMKFYAIDDPAHPIDSISIKK